MKFKIKHKLDSFTDIEQETAVDTVKTTHIEEKFKLTALSGLQIEIHVNTTIKENSFKEPDLDLLDKTGKTVYITTNEDPNSETRYFSSLKIPIETIVLSKEEALEYFKLSYYVLDEKLPPDLYEKFKLFKAQQNGTIDKLDEGFNYLPLSKSNEVIQNFLNIISEAQTKTINKEDFIEIEIPDEIKEILNKATDLNQKSLDSKLKNNIENMEVKAQHFLNRTLHHITNVHKHELKEGLPFNWGKKKF